MEQFPVGGPREPVYSFLRQHCYMMSRHSDKAWKRADGVELHLYGAGSMAQITKDGKVLADAPLAEAVAKVPHP
jgi:hypothetical protein